MSLFSPAPLLLLALANRKNTAGTDRAVLKTAQAQKAGKPEVSAHEVEIVEEPIKPRLRQAQPDPVQRASMLSDMLYYAGSPAAARVSSVVKAVTALQNPPPRVALPMSPQQRAMGMLKVVSQMSGVPSGPLSAMTMLSQAGQVGNIMSMLGNQTSAKNTLPSNIMDNVNKALSGMDPSKKEELLSMAKQVFNNIQSSGS